MAKSSKSDKATVITLGAERSIIAFLSQSKLDVNNLLRPSDSDYAIQYADWDTLPWKVKMKSRSEWLYSLLKTLSNDSEDYTVERLFAELIKPRRFECLGFHKEVKEDGKRPSAFFDGSVFRTKMKDDSEDQGKNQSEDEPKILLG